MNVQKMFITRACYKSLYGLLGMLSGLQALKLRLEQQRLHQMLWRLPVGIFFLRLGISYVFSWVIGYAELILVIRNEN